MTQVVPGQLWAEARNVDTADFRVVRDFIVAAVDGDQVTTVDVDRNVWQWRPALWSWGVGDDPHTKVTGPFARTSVAALQHQHFIQIADPKHVGCILPAVPIQGALFDLSEASDRS